MARLVVLCRGPFNSEDCLAVASLPLPVAAGARMLTDECSSASGSRLNPDAQVFATTCARWLPPSCSGIGGVADGEF